MECYSEQTCALAVDGELPAEQAQQLRDHLATCRRCRELVDALRAENHTLGESLRELPEEADMPLAFLSRRRSSRSWVWGDLALVAAVLAFGSMVSIWFHDLSIPAAMEWLNPGNSTTRADLIFSLFYNFVPGGASMLADYAAVVGFFSLLVLVGGSALLLGRRGRMRLPGLRLMIVVLAMSLPGFALEHRHADFVTVAANETVDDTLMAAGNTVRIEGVVNGDLMAFGQTVEVRGTVKGDLLSFAKRTIVTGTVEGRIFTMSQSLDLSGQLNHSLYGWAQSVRVDEKAHVGEGVVAGADEVSIEGDVKRGATLFAGNVDVSGNIGRELTMTGGTLTLTNTARVGGDLTARVHELRQVQIGDGAIIGGKRNIERQVRENRFSRPKFYFYQAVWITAAILVGWLGVMLVPAFFQSATQAVGSGWVSLGLGIGILAGAPLAMIVIAITLVGLPLSFLLLAAYLAAIYFSKIWVGAFLGRLLLKPTSASKGEWVLGLLVGLLILTVVGYIPYLGGLVRIGVVCLGVGAFALQLYRSSRPAVAA
jgi:cytoskeletal protein CcmA (bactofilin family)